MFEEVEERKARIDALRPFSAETEERLSRALDPLFIYHSNAIEGNTLSLGDTIYFLAEGRLPGGKREEEILEVKGQKRAIEYLREAVGSDWRLSGKLIREFHDLLTRDLPRERYAPGAYKPRDNMVRLPDGAMFPYTSHVETPAAMQGLVAWYDGERGRLHAVELAAHLHYRFILIHPFLDGNGRTARLLANLVLLQSGYAPLIVRAEDHKRRYLDALRAVDAGVPIAELRWDHPGLRMFPLVDYLERELLWSMDRMLDVLEGRMAVTPEDLVRRFVRLEEHGTMVAPAADDPERRRRLDQAVERTTRLVEEILRPVVLAADRQLGELTVSLSTTTDRAAVLIGTAGWRERLARPGLRGMGGSVEVRVQPRTGAAVGLRAPVAVFDAVALAEPHRVRLVAVRIAGGQAMDEIDLDPETVARAEIEPFLVQQVGRWLDAVEAEVVRLNHPDR